jgi:transposase
MMRHKKLFNDTRREALRRHGTLHPHPGRVQDEGFRSEEFLDPRDQVQVKYEMLRRHRVEGQSVSQAAASFGVSRQAFYLAEKAFDQEGVPGLVPRRRGPKQAHKCTDEVLDFVQQWRQAPTGPSVSEAVEQRFGVRIHPRSIDRALARRKKKPARKQLRR